MLKRTTVSLNQEYLDFLKLVSLEKRRSLSELVNEAVRAYLSKVRVEKRENKLFFSQLSKIKKDLKVNKKQLIDYIDKGRV